MEEAPGYAQVRIAPKPEKRLGWLEAALETQHGRIFSGWYYELDGLRYEIHTPVQAHVVLGEKAYSLTVAKLGHRVKPRQMPTMVYSAVSAKDVVSK